MVARSLFIVSCLARSLQAESDVPDLAGPQPDFTLRPEVGIAMIGGRFESGSVGDLELGADLRGGLRFDRWLVLGRAGIALVAPSTRHSLVDGNVRRFAGDVRCSLWRNRLLTTSRHGLARAWIRGDLWLGAGVGYEAVGWRGGGGDSRRDADVGLGYTLRQRWRAGDEHFASMTFALELVLAHPPTSKTDSTPTAAYDHTVLFSVGYMFDI
jgi:hypothetical protein